MKILIINPNSSEEMTAAIQNVASIYAAGDFEVKTVSTRLSALQSMKILAIIDTALLQLKQNVNFNLILASFCAQLRQMM